jgi:predicted small metal-binding protein
MSTDAGNGTETIFVIHCDCGYVVRGDIEVELLYNVRNHMDEAHPERRDTVSDEEILANAERQPAA